MSLFRDKPSLLPRFRRGDRDVCEEVYWFYVSRVETIAWAAVSRGGGWGRDATRARRAEVADLVQDVFMKAFTEKARLGYDGLRPYAPYLYTIARNVIVDVARARGREIPTEEGDLESFLQEAREPVNAYADTGTIEVVERFIRSLPSDLRAVHEKRYVAGLSQQSAANELGLSRQTVRTLEGRLHEGLQEALRAVEREHTTVFAAPREQTVRFRR
jgi:RNA polymerase sigma-70 factor (ECF subfamily)